jgi:hypothetical protein
MSRTPLAFWLLCVAHRLVPRDHRQLGLKRGFVLIAAEGAGGFDKPLRLGLAVGWAWLAGGQGRGTVWLGQRAETEDSMEWITVSKDVEDALKELDDGGDRAAAIVAATLVEEHLTVALECYLHRHPKVTKELFKISGPLGSFGAKIDLALLVGMFGHASYKELNTIKDLRNQFAH